MTTSRFFAARVAPLAAIGVCLAGCAVAPTQSSPSAASPTTPSAASTPTVTPSASPTPSYGPEEAAVRKLIGVTLYETEDAVASDYSIKLDALHQVMLGDLVDERLTMYLKYRAVGYKQTGRTLTDVRSVTSSKATFIVRACVDISQSDLLDKAGKSVVWAGSPKKVLHEFLVVNDRGAYKATADKAVEASC